MAKSMDVYVIWEHWRGSPVMPVVCLAEFQIVEIDQKFVFRVFVLGTVVHESSFTSNERAERARDEWIDCQIDAANQTYGRVGING